METYITIDELRRQCNIDFNDDDSLLYDLMEAAQIDTETYLNRPLTDFVKDGRLLAPIRHAIRIKVSTLYANREDIAFATPNTLGFIQMLLQPYKKYT